MWGWRDRIIGIIVGVALGVGVIVAFVFLFSEQTVDAPSLSPRPPTSASAPARRPQPGGPKVAKVRVVDGAPPVGGPPELEYEKGDEIRLEVRSDATVEVELTGYGLRRTVPADQPTEIDVRATRPGAFALIDADSHVDIARITVAAA